MNVQDGAILFNAYGILTVVAVSWLVSRRHPQPFFWNWARGYGCNLALILTDFVAAAAHRPIPVTLVEIVICLTGAWFFFQTSRLLQGRSALERRLYPIVIAIVAVLSAGALYAGVPYTSVATLPLLSLSASTVWLGIVLTRAVKTAGGVGVQWLGIPLVISGLLPLTFPLSAGTPWSWAGYIASGLIHMQVGTGMIVFLLEENTARLRLEHDRLVEADQAKLMFLSTISHELRTPLTAISGNLELLASEIGGPLTPDQTSFVGWIRQGTRQLGALIESLLDTVQAEAGHLRVKREPFELNETVEQTLASLRALVAKGELTLTTDLPAVGVTVEADPLRVVQVLNNLVGNAIKFTKPGGRIHVAGKIEGDYVQIAVIDSGIGIPEHLISRIFEPFFQVDGSLARKQGGSGLGLAITKRLITMMGGDLLVNSRQGEGSRFTFTLPLAPVRGLADQAVPL
jgi:signal transduction histidine kinase